MTTTAIDLRQHRRARQHRIESLLAELSEQRARAYRRSAAGARLAGLRDLKYDMHAARERLGQAIAS
jgi:hypothetical protein